MFWPNGKKIPKQKKKYMHWKILQMDKLLWKINIEFVFCSYSVFGWMVKITTYKAVLSGRFRIACTQGGNNNDSKAFGAWFIWSTTITLFENFFSVVCSFPCRAWFFFAPHNFFQFPGYPIFSPHILYIEYWWSSARIDTMRKQTSINRTVICIKYLRLLYPYINFIGLSVVRIAFIRQIEKI